MQTIEAPIIAAIIVSLTTILTVAVNVWSARIARRENKLENRSEWLKEKQIKDVEAIIPTLSAFLNDLHDCVEEIDISQWSVLNNFDDYRKVKGHSDLLQMYLDWINESAVKQKESFDALWDLESKRKTWFNFGAKRLSIWFYESDQIGPTLARIGERFHQYHIGIHQPSHSFRVLVEKFIKSKERIRDSQIDVFPFMDDDYPELKRLRDEFVQAKENWPTLDDLVLEFQTTLADKYKPANKQAKLSNDGLLVSMARQVEKGVRWLVRMK